jgi:hypothetical protein
LSAIGLLAGLCLASSTGIAWADRAPTSEERAAIEAALRGAGFTSWEEIEFEDDRANQQGSVWEVDDAVGPDGREYDLKLSQSYEIIDRSSD